MKGFSVYLKAVAFVAVIGCAQGQFLRKVVQQQPGSPIPVAGQFPPVSQIPRNIQPQVPFAPVPIVYGQAPRIPLENPQPKQLPQAPQQYYPQQQQLQQQQQQQPLLVAGSVNLPQVEMLQPQSSMLIPRLGRASRGMSLGRASDDEDVEEYAEEDLSHAPSKKKKKNKKKGSDSFPRRIIKKTTSAIRNTAGAVFGAPKYIYTRYRDTWVGGSKKSQKKKSKGKVQYADEDEDNKRGWGWESQYEGHSNKNNGGHEPAVIDHHHYPIDDQGYGYARNTAGAEADEYERKSGQGLRNMNNNPNQYNDYNEYKYKRYLYAAPSQMASNGLEEQGRGYMEAKQNKPGRLASLKAWFTQG